MVFNLVITLTISSAAYRAYLYVFHIKSISAYPFQSSITNFFLTGTIQVVTIFKENARPSLQELYTFWKLKFLKRSCDMLPAYLTLAKVPRTVSPLELTDILDG
jgi:hypothetical protein